VSVINVYNILILEEIRHEEIILRVIKFYTSYNDITHMTELYF